MPGLMRRDPFRDLMTMEREINRLFTDLGASVPVYTMRPEAEGMLVPSVDMLNKGEDLVIRAELPGLKPEDIDITVAEDLLTIRGTRHEEHEVKERDYIVRESSAGEFERTVRLPEGTKPDELKAQYRHGVLEVTVPHGALRAHETPIRVPIEGTAGEASELKPHG